MNNVYFMKKISVFNLLVSIVLLTACEYNILPKEKRLIDYVDPLIGSDNHGHVFVGANEPFGAVQLGPNNFYKGWDWSSGYHYSDSIFKGFSHLNLSGTGATDLGDILVMPATGELKIVSGSQHNHLAGYASKYSRENEIAEPGYYSVLLERYNIKAELTATQRVGFHKYTFPVSENAHIIIDLAEGNADKSTDTKITKIDNQTITGYRFSDGWSQDQRVYFAIKLSKPFNELLIFDSIKQLDILDAKGVQLKAVLNFTTTTNEELFLKVAISPVSEDNALLNLAAEILNWDFELVKKNTQLKWENELSKIQVSSSNENMETFYTALYHTMFAPSLYNDVNKDYLGTNKKKYTANSFENYTTFSLWDTYRAVHPLFTITQPERVNDMVNSMLAINDQQGYLPEWHLMGHDNSVMIGYSSVSVIADAYLKGYNGFDANRAYNACKKAAMRNVEGINYAHSLNYIPANKENESVAKAMEYAISDWAIAMMAKQMGKMEDYEYFLKRSKAYENYFDPEVKFMRGKNSDGTWYEPFDPVASSHRNDPYCEGNAWQYIWLVPHDVEGLVNLFEGEEYFIEKLDSLFTISSKLGHGASADISGLIGQYAHGNEPSHHIVYMYPYVGQQWKTAEKTRQIMSELYSNKPDGLSGNEDCGQMSAWYVFSALGFYPVNPQNGAYVFGSPMVDKAIIKTNMGKEFKIIAHNNNNKNIYIKQAKLNGKNYSKSFITHKDIQSGGILEFVMDSIPNVQYGKNEEDRPKSIVY